MCFLVFSLRPSPRFLPSQGQIFLDSFNPILENAIKPRVLEGKRQPCELKVSDFDDVMYTLEVRATEADATTIVH